MNTKFKKSELSNGIRVVSELHPGSRAVSMGIWVLTGTRDETPDVAGISHLLEHLVFKGTKTRSAYQIAKSLEALGGELNAYTTREYTCYHALVLKDHWEKALDVLADLVSNMKLTQKEFDLEKGVILQEIAMSEDSHEDMVYDVFYEQVYGAHPLGRPILGTPVSVARMKQTQVMNYYKKTYTGKNIIVSASGCIDHDDLMAGIQKRLGAKKKSELKNTRRVPRWLNRRHVVEKQAEQVHMLLGLPTASFQDKHRFEAVVTNTLLGGGMTSKLYQSVREKRGLVYSIHSSLNTNIDSGMLTIYAGTEAKNARKVGDLISKEFAKIRKAGVTKADVEMCKTQVIGSILLGSDDIENRMTSLAVNEMVFGRYRAVESVIDEIKAVTVDSVNEYIRNVLDLDKAAGVLLGPEVTKLQDWWQDLKL
ncbi:pitrilysin family protein [Bdellovibrio bacteriovorus]|uniref:Zinc proteinase n=2 Tax=Bdellovibrio bacteriovorus TaxID=959 RepID=K7ZF76_BDEBC|nr:pitrilysin family protein [Bdellovibrio bacteriovorus]AFY01242.1 zinc proteinase [Bdellovibrio bacteriovorus str. Tiberius]CAE79432.1 probable zinc proteinase [Bdellovibrio bacteriovorus HD100]